MAEAFLWGLVAGSSLVVGGVVSLRMRIGGRLLGLVMAFGAGVHGGRDVGLATTLGFGLAFALTTLE